MKYLLLIVGILFINSVQAERAYIECDSVSGASADQCNNEVSKLKRHLGNSFLKTMNDCAGYKMGGVQKYTAEVCYIDIHYD